MYYARSSFFARKSRKRRERPIHSNPICHHLIPSLRGKDERTGRKHWSPEKTSYHLGTSLYTLLFLALILVFPYFSRNFRIFLKMEKGRKRKEEGKRLMISFSVSLDQSRSSPAYSGRKRREKEK